MDKVKVIFNVAVCPHGYDKAFNPGEEAELDAELAAGYIQCGYVFESKPGARPTKNVGAMVPIEGIDE